MRIYEVVHNKNVPRRGLIVLTFQQRAYFLVVTVEVAAAGFAPA